MNRPDRRELERLCSELTQLADKDLGKAQKLLAGLSPEYQKAVNERLPEPMRKSLLGPRAGELGKGRVPTEPLF